MDTEKRVLLDPKRQAKKFNSDFVSDVYIKIPGTHPGIEKIHKISLVDIFKRLPSIEEGKFSRKERIFSFTDVKLNIYFLSGISGVISLNFSASFAAWLPFDGRNHEYETSGDDFIRGKITLDHYNTVIQEFECQGLSVSEKRALVELFDAGFSKFNRDKDIVYMI